MKKSARISYYHYHRHKPIDKKYTPIIEFLSTVQLLEIEIGSLESAYCETSNSKELQNSIALKLQMLNNSKNKTLYYIYLMEDSINRTILIERFLNSSSWEQISDKIHYSPKYVSTKLYEKALTEFSQTYHNFKIGDNTHQNKKGEELMTNRQKLFCEQYAKTNDATQSIIFAGYCAKDAELAARKLLDRKEVIDLITQLRQKEDNQFIAKEDEIIKFWTTVMRDDEAKIADRLKTSELLAKVSGIFVPSEDDETNAQTPPVPLEEKLDMINRILSSISTKQIGATK